jgi:hypothetical protein
VIPIGAIPPGASEVVPVARVATGSMRVTLSPGTLVTQTASGPTASTDAKSGTGTTALTSPEPGSMRVTVRPGPLARAEPGGDVARGGDRDRSRERAGGRAVTGRGSGI